MKITVILMGGARRVTLAEQFVTLLNSLDINPDFVSLERDAGFYPISQIAETIPAPKFLDASFDAFLVDTMCRYQHPLVVACMDAALLALSRLQGRKFGGATVVSPTVEGATIALDKGLTDQFCQQYGIPHPPRYLGIAESVGRGKVIAKPLQGFGGKGIAVFDAIEQVNEELFQTHIVQQFIEGRETTHDLYISADGKVWASSRDRLAVIDGEVDHCIVRHPTNGEMEIFNSIAATGRFRGPITVQTIMGQDEIYLVEINARFGGGATASIAAGFPGIELLIEETFGIRIPHRQFRTLEMKRARRDFYRLIENT